MSLCARVGRPMTQQNGVCFTSYINVHGPHYINGSMEKTSSTGLLNLSKIKN